MTDPGVTPEEVSLPVSEFYNPVGEPTLYTLLKPIQVQSGTAAPWFGNPGGAIQYLLPLPIAILRQHGFLQ